MLIPFFLIIATLSHGRPIGPLPPIPPSQLYYSPDPFEQTAQPDFESPDPQFTPETTPQFLPIQTSIQFSLSPSIPPSFSMQPILVSPSPTTIPSTAGTLSSIPFPTISTTSGTLSSASSPLSTTPSSIVSPTPQNIDHTSIETKQVSGEADNSADTPAAPESPLPPDPQGPGMGDPQGPGMGDPQGPGMGDPQGPGVGQPQGGGGESVMAQRTPCFPASATVQLLDGSVKSMRQLEIGDIVLVGSATYSPIHMFTHRHYHTTQVFIKLTTSSGHVLKATGGHFVYVGHTLRPARDVVVGDTLPTADGTWTTVTAVHEIVETGIYNPQTLTGDIVVDGIVASVYTEAVQPAMAHAALLPLRVMFSLFGLSTQVAHHGFPHIVPHVLRSMVAAK